VVAGARDLDQLVHAAFGRLVDGRLAEARQVLVRCATLLPTDATVREIARLGERDDVTLAQSARVCFVFPRRADATARAAWMATTEEELTAVLAWLEVGEAPPLLVDLTAPTCVPVTINRDRTRARKIAWPAELELARARDQLAHELVHACYLPHHRFFAEGIATLATARADELAALDRHLASAGAPPVDTARLLEEPGRIDASHLLSCAAAGSFVGYLVREHGKAALFDFCNSILYPATPAELREAPASFSRAFGRSCADAGAAWWRGLGR
jgi:hypothetical protein